MYSILKPILFGMDPEKAHNFTLRLFKWSMRIPLISDVLRSSFKSSTEPYNIMGLSFPNRVGLAAGFDKEGQYMSLMGKLGFGFLEIGTVTPLGQDGNDKPRLFRLKQDEALINRMGFNNQGLEAFERNLKTYKKEGIVIGANIGKNKITPNENAVDDYVTCFNRLQDLADYFVVNVSSPNTPGLRALQSKGPLLEILNALQKINNSRSEPKPILLKIAPDLNEFEIKDIADIVLQSQITGVVATNTTIDRTGLKATSEQIESIGNGGLSGAPLREKSTQVISQLRELLPTQVIIGVGGIDSIEAAQEKVNAGADLVQVYSGLVYQGPWLIKNIAKAIR